MNQSGWESRRYGHILALKNPQGRILGFHSRNLEVAELSTELWDSFLTDAPKTSGEEARQALLEWNHFQDPRVRRDPTSSGKLSALTLNVTQICNLACTYCAAGGNGSYGDPVKRISVEKTLPQLRSLMQRAESGRAFQITFLGGEPLLYPEGIRILAEVAREEAKALDLDLQFVVVTNGTQFTASNITLLHDLKAQVTLSMDGDAELNDQRRQTVNGRGVSAQIIQGLETLLASRQSLPKEFNRVSSVGISGVFGDGHLDLERAWNFYRRFNVDWFDFTYDHHEIKAEPSEEFTRSLIRLARKAYALGGETELRRIKTFNHYFELLDQQQQIENYCGAGKSFLMVDARNQITTCPWLVGESREVVGVGTELWESRLAKLSEPLIEKNNCGDCWARYLCGGGCMYIHRNRTGDKHSVDSHFCERTKTLIAEALELYVQARSASSQTEKNPVQEQRGHDESA